ncbi:hypothetical protein [Paraburkholderia sp. C35]|uniref:hypothetical protein n=1 Tax=Paraburkholderia sp. C35 TaxID=2126993 RepID=UPI000D68E5A3|nr:hypothetical protein [Paraburkholderia sp. C35]
MSTIASIARAIGFTLTALASFTTTPAHAGSKSATMSVGVTIVDSCTVTATTTSTAPGVACSSNTVQPIVEQRLVAQGSTDASNTSNTASTREQQTALTVVTY